MSDKLILSLDTGDVTIEMFPEKAPNHVARIKELAEDGFYDGLSAHRVIDGFMAQMGCPRGDGTGGSGQNIDAEFNDVSHQRGVCSMARAQNPNSADSQFFICFDDASFLDGQYTAWGKVVDGMEHVDAMNRGEPPSTPTKIVSMKVAA
ncbi:peptidylprolyl isomerase [Hyphococcus flavus]|uniref:Peptidyl-prolyl cis-trans isomerase n=1 Tax=Hyphococcus flavus TaxID=1866326 RepID=A0AAF0CFB2_9PROT|nr:peptidylprolyl isomerase [Hyphococcus flavus]WDI31259.1 peptidylprolyl isomerase [Hyphococcus flavus]